MIYRVIFSIAVLSLVLFVRGAEPVFWPVYLAFILGYALQTKSVHQPVLLRLVFLGALIGLFSLETRLESFFGLGLMVIGVIFVCGATVHHLREKKPIFTRGFYSISRHPRYFGFLLFFTGLCFNSVSLVPATFFGLVASSIVIYLAWREELELTAVYPAEFYPYSKRTPFIIPSLTNTFREVFHI